MTGNTLSCGCDDRAQIRGYGWQTKTSVTNTKTPEPQTYQNKRTLAVRLSSFQVMPRMKGRILK